MARSGRSRKPRITLPRHHSYIDVEGKRMLQIDRDAIRKEEDDAHKTATPERLAKADAVSMGDDRVQRLVSDPIEILAGRRALHPDIKRNAVLFDAAKRFRGHWHAAGLSGVGAQDLNKVAGVSAGPAWSMPLSEYAAKNRSECRAAVARLGDYLAKWVVAIVVEERRPEEAGRNMSSYIDADTARAIAIECLRAGLTTLAEHWEMFGRPS